MSDFVENSIKQSLLSSPRMPMTVQMANELNIESLDDGTQITLLDSGVLYRGNIKCNVLDKVVFILESKSFVKII